MAGLGGGELHARVDAQRAEVEAEHARVDAAGDVERALYAEADAKAAAARVYAQSNRAIQEAELDRAVSSDERRASAAFEVPLVWAALVVLAVLGVIMYMITAFVEQSTTGWAQRSQMANA